jgi:precorrin-2 methylase
VKLPQDQPLGLAEQMDMPLTLEATSMEVVKWWIDAAFAVHPDLKSHTGGAMSLGKGVVYDTPKAEHQELNRR